MRGTIAVFALASGLSAGSARADLPPPQGKKQVSYSFQVTGLGASADWVLIAHPYPVSEGGVTRRFAKVEDGKPMRVDRRNGTPKLYAMKKQAWTDWLAKYQPAKDPNADPAVEALFASAQVVACNRGPEPVSLLDTSDPRSEVVEAFVARPMDGKTCQLDGGAATQPAASAKSAPPVETPAPPSSSSPPVATEPPPAPKTGGCGGCATSTGQRSTGAVAWLAGLALLFGRRRPPGTDSGARRRRALPWRKRFELR